ncbi:MAG: acyl-CoA dehydratase activase-related protein [Bacilli bacterium]
MKIGIPKALYYYYFYDKWFYFFKELGVEVVTSLDTNKDIIDKGSFYATDEMCLSLKIFLGHVHDLKDKCDYILIPNIDNYGLSNQMCCNYSALYDLVNNLFSFKILTYDINYVKNKKEVMGFIKMGKQLGFKKKQIMKAYKIACIKNNKIVKKHIINNNNKLKSSKKKILLVGHPYNMYDNYLSSMITTYLNNLDLAVIYSDRFASDVTNKLATYLSRDLYWKYSKENIGSIVLCQDKVDGIIFLSSFPCGIDSLVNELVMRKINKPYLNLIIDDLSSSTGMETRLESFVDILEQS